MEQRPLPHQKIIYVCTNQREPGERVCCAAGGGAALHARLKEMVKERGLRVRVRVSKSGCMDRCEFGPNLMLFPDNVWYCNVKDEDLEPLLDGIEAELKASAELERSL